LGEIVRRLLPAAPGHHVGISQTRDLGARRADGEHRLHAIVGDAAHVLQRDRLHAARAQSRAGTEAALAGGDFLEAGHRSRIPSWKTVYGGTDPPSSALRA